MKRRRLSVVEAVLILATILGVSVALASSLNMTQLQPHNGLLSGRSFTLIAENWGYNQTFGGPVLRVSLGEMVTITLVVPGQLSHNLHIDGYGILIGGEFGLRRGENQTVTFLANQLGTFRYYCQTSIYGGHAELGQQGMFVVEPAQ